jgi:tetratricopeptide (TPR) repeat protein
MKDKKAKASAAVSPARGPAWWHFALAGALVLFLLFEVYGPALRGPFVLDDLAAGFASATEDPDRPVRRWLENTTRPVTQLSFWANFRLSGSNTYSYHAVNVVLHFANGVLLALCLAKLLALAGEVRARLLAALGAAIFWFHPVHAESVAYISSRTEVLSLFFFLGAYACFLWRRAEAASWGVAGVVLVLAALAALSKEHAVTLPVLLLLTDLFFTPGGPRRNWRLYLPLAAGGVAAAAFLSRVLLRADTAGFGVQGLSWSDYFFTQCRALWVYARLFVFPAGLNADPDFPISRSLTDHGAIFGLLGLLAAAGAALYWRKQAPLAAFGLLAALLLFAPTSSFVPIRDPLAERRLYLPFLGLLLVAFEGVRRIRWSVPALAGAGLAVTAVLAAATYQRAGVWGDPLALWTDAVAKSPRKARPHFQYAFALFERGRCPEAVKAFEETAKLQPPAYDLLIDWGLALACAGQDDAALAKFREAVQLEPQAHGYAMIAMLLLRKRDVAGALAELDAADRVQPGSDIAAFYRGAAYEMQGDAAQAVAAYRRAVQSNPRNQPAQEALARLSVGR